MVELITGGARSSREDIFIERICAAANKGERVLVIVPDQFSFEYDKRLYEAMGAQSFNSITTTGFNRLAELIGSEYGAAAKDQANENARIILMYKAVRNFSKSGSIKFYRNSLNKPSFISDLISLVTQLRESGIAPEALQLAAERLNGSVSLKLVDLSQIYRLYLDELENSGMQDSLSAMAEAVVLSAERGYFKGMSVFISSFTGFSYDESRILDTCIASADNVTVSLLLDNKVIRTCKTHPFDVTVKTQQLITDMARAHNKQLLFSSADDNNANSMDIMHLSEHLFDFNRVKYTANSKTVRVLSADDTYEEADFICAEICRLVREEGYSFNDIVITVRELGSFAPVIGSALEKYDIPFFIDRRDSVDASAIVHYINAVFRTVLTRKFRTENIMKLIKSPLYGLLNYEICDLEDYCIRWGVDGDMWLSPFTAPTSGGASLERINELREKVMAPLVKFRDACADSTAAAISRAFYDLLGDIRLSEQTYSLVRRVSTSDNETETELSRGLKQLWTMSLSAVRSIYEILGDEKISLRRYYELYSVMLSQMKISDPPQKLDCVRVIDAARSRIGDVKAVFAAQVNDGVFPAAVGSTGLITEHEKELLRLSEDIVIEANVLNDLKHERLTAYTALSAPSDRLYITYPMSDLLGNEKRPSMLVREVKEILGVTTEQINKLPVDFFCTSYKTAYIKYIEHSRDDSVSVKSIYDSLMGSPYYFDKITSLRKNNSGKAYKLEHDNAEKLFFGKETAEVSPTKLDNYFKCPFMYYCNYGLRLYKESKMEINGMNKGIMVHSVLENAIDTSSGDPAQAKKKFLDMKDDDITALIDRCFDEYYNNDFGGDFGENETFAYRFDDMKHQTFNIVKYVQRELANSEFAPVVTEFKLTAEEGTNHLDLTLKDGRHIVLIGTIDRADIYENEDGEKFVRIIDYKFRKKVSFSLADLYCGLDLQMLVYLSILLETGNPVNPNGDLKQAGVFYLKLTDDREELSEDCELSEDVLYSAACESAINAFSRKGKISGGSEVNKVLDHTINGSALSRMTMEDPKFTAMRIFAKRKVIEYGDRLLDGDIDAKPLENVCRNCDYSGICGRAYPDDVISGDDKKMEQILDEIVKEISGKEEE